MAKIKLGTRPKSFSRSVVVPMHEGGEGEMTVSYVYRTRTEYGEFVDSLTADAGVQLAGPTDEDIKFSLAKAMTAARDKNADYLMKILDGWNLESEFSRDAVVQLCDELPGAALAIMNGYTAAITEGRLGN